MDSDLRSKLHQYVSDKFVQEDRDLAFIREETARHSLPLINLDPYEGRMLQVLVAMSGAKKVIEIGTLAGYSGLWIARGLPADGKLITIEKSSKHASIARHHFDTAGFSDKVRVYQGNALQILQKIASDAPYDLVFIDADKPNYVKYLEWAVEHLRMGGTVMAHNAFWGGRILEPNHTDDHAMIAFNDALANHPQLESTIIEVGDGLAVGVKVS